MKSRNKSPRPLDQEREMARENKAKKDCVINGCFRKVNARGLCHACYQRAYNLVKKDKTTWQALAEQGLAKLSKGSGNQNPSPFTEAILKKSGKPEALVAKRLVENPVNGIILTEAGRVLVANTSRPQNPAPSSIEIIPSKATLINSGHMPKPSYDGIVGAPAPERPPNEDPAMWAAVEKATEEQVGSPLSETHVIISDVAAESTDGGPDRSIAPPVQCNNGMSPGPDPATVDASRQVAREGRGGTIDEILVDAELFTCGSHCGSVPTKDWVATDVLTTFRAEEPNFDIKSMTCDSYRVKKEILQRRAVPADDIGVNACDQWLDVTAKELPWIKAGHLVSLDLCWQPGPFAAVGMKFRPGTLPGLGAALHTVETRDLKEEVDVMAGKLDLPELTENIKFQNPHSCFDPALDRTVLDDPDEGLITFTEEQTQASRLRANERGARKFVNSYSEEIGLRVVQELDAAQEADKGPAEDCEGPFYESTDGKQFAIQAMRDRYNDWVEWPNRGGMDEFLGLEKKLKKELDTAYLRTLGPTEIPHEDLDPALMCSPEEIASDPTGDLGTRPRTEPEPMDSRAATHQDPPDNGGLIRTGPEMMDHVEEPSPLFRSIRPPDMEAAVVDAYDQGDRGTLRGRIGELQAAKGTPAGPPEVAKTYASNDPRSFRHRHPVDPDAAVAAGSFDVAPSQSQDDTDLDSVPLNGYPGQEAARSSQPQGDGSDSVSYKVGEKPLTPQQHAAILAEDQRWRRGVDVPDEPDIPAAQ